ncbi:DMT family transporter [Candidatus Woesearchaeota archaeon]|nr:DMT family transporter [Candidatus Woesearchaeota archaeon]
MQKGYYLVLSTAVISGVSIFLNKWAVQGLDPYLFTFAKNVIVALFLISIILLLGQFSELKALKAKHWLQLTIIGLVGGSVPFLMFFKGLQLTSAATASFIHKTMFIYVAILAAIFLKEKINKGFLAGAILLLAGNYLLLKFDAFDTGALLILGAAILWAVENTLSKYVLRSMHSTIVAWGRMFFGSLFILAFLLASGNITKAAIPSMQHFEWIFFTSILLLLYVTTWYEGLRTIDASVATCILLLGSVVTTALQFAFLGKQVVLAEIVGTLLIALGVATVTYFATPKVEYGWH